jgi:hypothetical protein
MDDRVCEVAFVFALVICLMQVNKVLFLAFSLNAEVQEDETTLMELSAST